MRSQGRARLILKIAISVVLASAAIGIMAFSIARSAGVFLRVDQLVENTGRWKGKNVWLQGRLVPESHKYKPEKDSRNESHIFVLEWKGRRIAVRYKGAVPSGFLPGRRVTVQGKLLSPTLFAAAEVTTRCPSKYKSR